MTTATKTAYEAMFLISQSEAVDFAGVIQHITDCMTRHGGELISMKKWDERRLAYEIDKQRRGVYLLAYFSCDGTEITAIERDLNLSERVMRHMFIRADHLSVDQMQAIDAREELAVEAKFRAERAAEAASRDGSVTLGRKEEPEAAPEADTAAADAAPEGDTEAKAEASAEAPAEEAKAEAAPEA